jgi:hypothetical protein
MARAKTPQQKKQESYARDRVEGARYPHGARKSRPRVKARAQRHLRRKSRQQLASEPEEVLQLEAKPRRTWQKTGIPLPKHLIATRKTRIERAAHNIFKKGYGPTTHARFRRVVESWIQGGSAQSAALADLYDAMFHPEERGIQPFFGPEWAYQRDYFLRQFFRREPELKRRFDRWIASFQRTR